RPQSLCRGQICAVHDVRFGPDVYWLRLALQRFRHVRLARYPESVANRRDYFAAADGNVALPLVLLGFRDQGAALPAAHMAARRARGSSDGWLRYSGRRAAENGHLRHDSFLPAAFSRRFAPQRRLDRRAGDYRHHLWRAGGVDPAEPEKARGVFI